MFISRMHALGFRYDSVAEFYESFSRRYGETPLSKLTPTDVAAFLNRPRIANSTWHQHYDKLRVFFRFMRCLGKLDSLPLPPRRPVYKKTFIPYIYSRKEIAALTNRRLLKRAMSDPNQVNVLEPEMFRTLILFLYGTGALQSEALNLRWKDVDFRHNLMSVTRHEDVSRRKLPFGRDVHKLLKRYRSSLKENGTREEYCFVTKKGTRIAHSTLVANFRAIRTLAGIVRPGGRHHQARMHDLRNTFAVHRLASWYRNGIDVDMMMPALGAYMGFYGLRPTQRYLFLTPEHYQAQLTGVPSPKAPPTKRWRQFRGDLRSSPSFAGPGRSSRSEGELVSSRSSGL
jgi:integrase